MLPLTQEAPVLAKQDLSPVRNPRPTFRLQVRQSSTSDETRSILLSIGDSSNPSLELIYNDEHIYLLHENRKIIDLSKTEKHTFHSSFSISLEGGMITIINGSGHIQGEYKGIKHIVIFNGTYVSEFHRTMNRVHASEGLMYINKGGAFLSSSRHFNILFINQLARIVSYQSDVTVTFQTLPGEDLILLVNGDPIITLSDSQVSSLEVIQFIKYTNDTIYVRDAIRQTVENIYKHVTQLYVSNRIHSGFESFREFATTVIPGGGILYIHELSGTALYSRNSQLNFAINNQIKYYLSEPSPNMVFSIQFELRQAKGTERQPFVIVLADGNEIICLDPTDTEHQSLTLEHSLLYTNKALFIMNGDFVAETFTEVEELTVFDGSVLMTYKGSAGHRAKDQFVGGGQIFSSGFRAFYSTHIHLNDQIGEAVFAVLTDRASTPNSVDVISLDETTPPTISSYTSSSLFTTTSYETTDAPKAPTGVEKSGQTKTVTHSTSDSPRPAKPVAKTRSSGSRPS